MDVIGVHERISLVVEIAAEFEVDEVEEDYSGENCCHEDVAEPSEEEEAAKGKISKFPLTDKSFMVQ